MSLSRIVAAKPPSRTLQLPLPRGHAIWHGFSTGIYPRCRLEIELLQLMRIHAGFHGGWAYGTGDCQSQRCVGFLFGFALFDLVSKLLFHERLHADVEFQSVAFIGWNLGSSILEASHEAHSPFAVGHPPGGGAVWMYASFRRTGVQAGPIAVNPDLDHRHGVRGRGAMHGPRPVAARFRLQR